MLTIGTKISLAEKVAESSRFSKVRLSQQPSPSSSPSPPSLSQSPTPSLSPSLATSTSSLPYPSLYPSPSLSLLPLFSPSPSPSLSHFQSLSLLLALPPSLSKSLSPSLSKSPLLSVLPSLSTSSPPLLCRSPARAPSTTLSPSSQLTVNVITKDFLSVLNKTDYTNKTSLQNVVSLFETTMKRVLKEQPTERHQESFFDLASAFEEFSLNYGKYHLNGTTPQKFNNSEIVLQIQRVYRENESDFYLGSSQEEDHIKIPHQNFNSNDSIIVGVIYKKAHELFKKTQSKRRINSKIMTVFMHHKPRRLEKNITLKFRNLEDLKGECIFWDNSNESNPKGWSRQGCHAVNSSSGVTECSCNHMTSFALQGSNNEKFEKLIDNLQQVLVNMRDGNRQAEEIFKILTSFEDTFIMNISTQLNGSSPLIHNSSEIFLRIQRISSQNGSNFHLETARNQNLLKVPSENADQNGSVVLGIVYKQLHELFPTAQTDSTAAKKARQLNSNIMAVVVHPKPKALRKNITLKFPNLKALKGDCMFWDTSNETNTQDWSGRGCREVPSKSNSEETECTCNHLTHFAVLFNLGNKQAELTDTDKKILGILTYVGLALSITGAILTIISYIILTDFHQPLSQIRVSLAGSLGAAQIVFLAGIDRTENTKACVAVAVLMQYFLMAAFCWMLVEGIYLYLFVVKVYNVSTKVKIYHGLSWGFPVVMVATSLSIAEVKDGIHSFVSKEYCWMPSNNKLIWIFVAFVATVELINVVILVRVVREMTTMQHTKDNVSEQIRIGIKACVVMVPLLGVTWLFGFLSQLHKSFFYIFTILNSIQGFLIFLLHCVRNSQIRERFKTRMFAKSLARTERNHAVTTLEVKQDEDEDHPCLFELE